MLNFNHPNREPNFFKLRQINIQGSYKTSTFKIVKWVKKDCKFRERLENG